MIILGSEVEDKVTGFQGVVVARLEYLNGCMQYCVKPRIKKGQKMPDGEYIDEGQLELIGPGVTGPEFEVHALAEEERPGGVMPDCPKERRTCRLTRDSVGCWIRD